MTKTGFLFLFKSRISSSLLLGSTQHFLRYHIIYVFQAMSFSSVISSQSQHDFPEIIYFYKFPRIESWRAPNYPLFVCISETYQDILNYNSQQKNFDENYTYADRSVRLATQFYSKYFLGEFGIITSKKEEMFYKNKQLAWRFFV